MTRFLIIVFCILSIAACKPGVPDDVIQPEEMEKILFDIHLVDGYISSIPTQDSARKFSAPIYKGIYKKHGVDSAAHAKSMSYYYKHPDMLIKMYDRIGAKMGKAKEDALKKQDAEVKLAEKKEKQRQAREKAKLADSLKKVEKAKKLDTVAKTSVKNQTTNNQKPAQAVKK